MAGRAGSGRDWPARGAQLRRIHGRVFNVSNRFQLRLPRIRIHAVAACAWADRQPADQGSAIRSYSVMSFRSFAAAAGGRLGGWPARARPSHRSGRRVDLSESEPMSPCIVTAAAQGPGAPPPRRTQALFSAFTLSCAARPSLASRSRTGPLPLQSLREQRAERMLGPCKLSARRRRELRARQR